MAVYEAVNYLINIVIAFILAMKDTFAKKLADFTHFSPCQGAMEVNRHSQRFYSLVAFNSNNFPTELLCIVAIRLETPQLLKLLLKLSHFALNFL